MASTSERPRARGNAAERILAAAAECVGQLGAAQVSLQTVADSAGVSKALIHYHFRDRDELLARLVDWVTVELVHGEEVALADADAATALDALWRWLEAELTSGRLRALGELAGERGEAVRDAVRRSREARRAQATLTIERLFAALSLTPRLPAPLVGDVTVAFLDGLAGEVAVEPEGNHRLRFDVFWLSVLSLAE
ncbi:regulatory protein TetR [Gemmatirosa kalamazoonensis]|jgi:AcrR family transcriptional regulator|uniref:Regulatory protein TetR n=1 Tax=Gemmatirosa kalamazoonensis TaxID=861299 RepID=W0RDF0_9BACT|nr:TetR/AcrR family transcriptional regulator [Gemmatirosa kalamazoonensis]AHG88467.1 regulatory protein TetR [Gemmatirosa kalamazoonensis]